uniref:GAR domain-containing protein n=1 Tax=Syphacia muris TaxID=451379 RepID=A0A0N5AJF6_9BILA
MLNSVGSAVIDNAKTISSPKDAENLQKDIEALHLKLKTDATIIETSIKEADRLCAEEADMLTPDQFHGLKERRNQLESTYMRLLQHSDELLKKVNDITKFLLEFTSSASAFQSFITCKTREIGVIKAESGDLDKISVSMRRAEVLEDDVLRSKEQLEAIMNLLRQVRKALDDYAVELHIPYPNVKITTLDAPELGETLNTLQMDYGVLVEECSNLKEFLERLLSLSSHHNKNITTFEEEMVQLEAQINEAFEKVTKDDVISDAASASALLTELENLQTFSLEQDNRFDEIKKHADKLEEALTGTDAQKRIALESKQVLEDFKRRQNRARESIDGSVDSWRSKMAKSEGLREGVKDLLEWLSREQERLKSAPQLPLILSQLTEIKNEGEFAHKEIISRQKVLNSFEKEIFRNGDVKSAEVKNPELVAQYRKAESMFQPLISVSKAYCENVAELCTLLSSLNDGRKLLNDKIDIVEKKIGGISPLNQSDMESISSTLNELIAEDLQKLKDLENRIIEMPNTVEIDDVVTPMLNIEERINNLCKKLSSLKDRSENLLELKATYEEKKKNLDNKLCSLKAKLDDLDKIPLQEQQIVAQRMICEEVQNDYRSLQCDLDSFCKIGSDLIQLETITRAYGAGATDYEDQGYRLREVSSVAQRYDALAGQLKHKTEQIGLINEKLCDLYTTKNKLMQWTVQQCCMLEAECPAALTESDIAKNLSKVAKIEKTMEKDMLPSLQELRTKVKSLLNDASTTGGTDVLEAEKEVEKAWEKLQQTIGLIKHHSDVSRRLLEDAEDMDKWLKQKVRMLNVMEETINVDPKVINGQLVQVELLSSEMTDQESNRNKLNDLANELINNSDGVNRQQIIEKMDELNRKWVTFSNKLKSDAAKLSDVKESITRFSALQRSIKSTLLELAENVEEISRCPLTDSEVFEEHLNKLCQLQEKSSSVKEKVEELRSLGDFIALCLPSVENDVSEQLHASAKYAEELDKRIESLKNASLNAKKMESETTKEVESTFKWLKGVKGQLNDIGNVSADPRVLAEQTKNIGELYTDVLGREGDIALLRAKLNEQLKKSANPGLKTLYDNLYAEWIPVLEETKKKHATVEKVSALVKQLENMLDTFDQQTAVAQNNLKELSLGKMSDVKEMERQVELSMVELNSFEPLMSKLEKAVGGKSTSTLRRRLDNAQNDWAVLAKDVRNLVAKQQNKNELQNHFDKCKLETTALLNSAHEVIAPLDGKVGMESSIISVLPDKSAIEKVISDLKTGWIRQSNEMKCTAGEMQNVIDADEAAALRSNIDELESSYKELLDKLENKLDELIHKEEQADQLNYQVLEIGKDVQKIGSVMLYPIDVQTDHLKQEQSKCDELLQEINDKEKALNDLTNQLKSDCESGIITSSQLDGSLNQLIKTKEELASHKRRISQRKDKVSELLSSVENLQSEVGDICRELEDMSQCDILQKPIKPDLANLKGHQEEIRSFKDKLRKEIGGRVEKSIGDCDKLLKSADKQANVSEIDFIKSKLVQSWNDVCGCVSEHEKQVCSSIQELGTYADAYKALLAWLEDTEEALDNQQPPSTEYKVVKAQSAANDILLKHIEEKQPSVEKLKALMGKVVPVSGGDSQYITVKDSSEDFAKRYSQLLERAHTSRTQLHEALELAEKWSHLAAPLLLWLDATEKSVQQLGKVPVNKEVMQQQIDAHQTLQENIELKQREFDQLTAFCPRLAGLTSEKEAEELEEHMNGLLCRYQDLRDRTNQCGLLLKQLDEDIGCFLDETNALAEWLDKMENEIDKIQDISIHPDELIEQSSTLTELAMEVTDEEALVANVVENGRDLCRHTSGDEAIVLQTRIEGLRNRYLQLAAVTDSKIALLSEALPLAERFEDGYTNLQQWMDAVDQDLQDIDQVPLEAQSTLVNQMEEDLNKWRSDVDEVNNISKQLIHLSERQTADELESRTDDLNRRFNVLADQVTRKAEKLALAEKQSRQVLDELDYLNGWFSDALERLKQASAPAVDPDYVKKQLKNQKLMNDDIAVMRSRLRDATADAQKVARALGDEADGQNALVASKIEAGRELSTEVAELGEKRLEELGQALALCQEVEQSFGELHTWLENIEAQIESTSKLNTGIQRHELLEQQAINAELEESIQSQKPLLDRFERNATALGELCDDEDTAQLYKIAEGLQERYEEVKNAVKNRALALDSAIEHSSQFTDRLDVILSKLGGAAAQIRNPDPVSADPERIRSQISDNMALKEELKLKEGALQSVKESADVILKQAKSNDPAVTEINAKIEKLDALWQELNNGVAARGNELENTLAKTVRFWSDLEKCQNAIEELRVKITDIQPAAGQPAVIKEQQNTLLAIEGDIHETEPMVNELRLAGMDLCSSVASDERTHVEQQIGVVESNWATVTDLYALKNKDLIDAMENAMEFHGLYSELLNWMLEREEKMAEFSRMPGPSSTDVKNELAALDEMKTVLDEKVVQKERLNQLCANLCVGATVQQCAAIRAPLNDLNNRWNKLYVTLNERQQKVERALLEMGQFSQAYDQLMGWIEKTSHTLEEIDSAPANLKQVEIEVCKYKVVQNDIRAHETSVETLNSAAKRIINADPNSTSATQPMIDELNSQWHMLVDKLDNLWTQLTGAREAAESLGGEMDKWALWLQDKDADLSHSKPFAGLPETARAQLDDFFVLKAEIEQNKPELEAHLEAGAKYLSSNAENKDSWVAQKQQQLRRKWIQIQEKLCDKEQKLRIALADAEQLSAALNAMNDWLSNAETRLGILEPVSRIPENLERQIAEQKSFETEVAEQRDLMADLKSKGTKLQYLCEKKDAIPIKNNLVSARHRLDKITSRCADRGKQLESCYKDSTLYFDSCVDLMEWLNTSLKWIEDRNAEALFGENIREALDQHKNFQRELGTKQPLFDTTYKRGKSLSDHAPKAEQATFDDMNETLREHWSQLCNASIQRQRNIEETLLESGQFDDALSSLREWLEKTLPEVEVKSGESAYGDMETVNLFAEENQAFKDELASRQGSLDSVRRRAEQILNARKECDSSEGLRNNLNQLNNDWEKLESLVSKRQDNISEALEKATVFGDEARSILDWLPRIEDRLRMKGQKAETETEILDHMDEVAQIRKELDDASPRLEKVLNLGREILSKCHTNAEQNMKYWLKVLQTRWDEQLTDLHEQEELISKLLKFINAKDADLKVLSSNELPYDMEEVEKLLIEHEEFDNSLREKQNEVSNATVGRRMPIVSPQSAQPAKHQKPLLKKEKPVRHPKADLLSQKWNRLWLDSVEYGSRLRKMKEHLEELKKLESFTFDEWRERYLEWTDFGKARISDLFRRIDKSGTGSVPRNAFIEEILRSRFPTTQLEMEKVADEFDKGDGLIDSKEFMARLRSEFAKKLPMKQKTEGEKINEEVQRQSEKCSCHTPYRIQKVSEGHYRFGDTQIKRMVRILRFTVMVRVGGGWVALDEFLHKHDPCRAKGRTNIDLQRGFYNDVRPINAHDSMKMFTKSRSASNRASPVTVGSDIGQYSRYATTPGPITKIREKTERSVPMHIEKHTPSSSQVSLNEGSFLPRRTSDVSMQDGKIRRSSISSNISRSNSRGEIYDMLRPSSRCSESSDLFERPTRIPSLRGKKGVNYRPSSARNSPHC